MPAYDVAWKRIAPGQFSVTRDLDEGSVIRGAVQVGPHAIPFGPITLGSSIEWAFEPERISELRAISQQTGGRELLDLKTAWLRPPFIHDSSLRIPLSLTVFALLIIEALLTRTGWKMPSFALAPRIPKPAKIKVAKVKKSSYNPEPLDIPKEDKPIFHEKTDDDDDQRRSRYQKAKDRK